MEAKVICHCGSCGHKNEIVTEDLNFFCVKCKRYISLTKHLKEIYRNGDYV